MRSITFIFLLVHTIAFSQDCSNIIIKVDKFTSDTTIQLKTPLIIKESGTTENFISQFVYYKNANLKVILFSCKSINCVDESSKVYILFKDGTRLIINSMSDFECNGIMTIAVTGSASSNSTEPMESLFSKKIAALRIYGFSSIVDVELTEKESNTFYNQIQCWNNKIVSRK